jgi:hypothetical protein
MLPISPQNFDPLDKTKDISSQKKTIFSISAKSKPSYEPIFEVENPQVKGEEISNETEIKMILIKEMRVHLDSLKDELLESFSNFLKDHRNMGKINNEDVQDLKRQILYNKKKFEEIQGNISQVSQQFTEVNSLYSKELETLKSSMSFSQTFRGERSSDFQMPNELAQKQLELQFKTFKQGLLSEVHNSLKGKSKSRLNEDVVGELKQIKHNFESDLKQNFEMINGRVKRSEENLNEIMRKKRDYMDAIRDEFLTSIEHQETVLTQEIKQLEGLTKSKCEKTQAKAIVSGEIGKRMDLFRTEVDALRKAIASSQEEMERIDSFVNRKLESLDYDMKRQYFELQTQLQKNGGSQQNHDFIERKIQKLSGDSEGYYKTIQQLKTQVEEVSKIHQLLQLQSSNPSTQETINRLEEKITGLQNYIEDLEIQVRKQQPLKKEKPVSQYSPQERLGNDPIQTVDQLEISSKNSSQGQDVDSDENFEKELQQQSEQRLNSARGTVENYARPTFNTSPIKYYGDPKVKSIIDEFQQKKRQALASIDTKKAPVQDEKPLQSFNTSSSFYENLVKSPRERPRRPNQKRQSPTVNNEILSPESSRTQSQYKETSYLNETKVDEFNYSIRDQVETEDSPRSQIQLIKIETKTVADQFEPKKVKHAKILAQINYFINGTVSEILNDEEDSEIYCNLDDDGYIFDDDGDFVLNSQGIKVKLTPAQIEKFNNNNMIE